MMKGGKLSCWHAHLVFVCRRKLLLCLRGFIGTWFSFMRVSNSKETFFFLSSKSEVCSTVKANSSPSSSPSPSTGWAKFHGRNRPRRRRVNREEASKSFQFNSNIHRMEKKRIWERKGEKVLFFFQLRRKIKEH